MNEHTPLGGEQHARNGDSQRDGAGRAASPPSHGPSRFGEGIRFPRGPLHRHIDELDAGKVDKETVARLSNARVAYADYALIQHDFPHLRDEAQITARPALLALSPGERCAEIEAHIDRWLIRNGAVMSERQVGQTDTNHPIPVTGETWTAQRPPRYGRAFITELDCEGPARLIDIKGCGRPPKHAPKLVPHQSGVMFLGEAISDLLYQLLIDRIFRHAGTHFWTVPTYAVLDLGFLIKSNEGNERPAGAQLRRAHQRAVRSLELPIPGTIEERAKIEIELLLRHYGVTSTNDGTTLEVRREGAKLKGRYGPAGMKEYGEQKTQRLRELLAGRDHVKFEGVNVQLVRDVTSPPTRTQVVDFGHFEVREAFTDPVASLTRSDLFLLGRHIEPTSPHFAHINPGLAVPYDVFGDPTDPAAIEDSRRISGDCRRQKPDVLCFDLADRFARGEAGPTDLSQLLDQLLEAGTGHWPTR